MRFPPAALLLLFACASASDAPQARPRPGVPPTAARGLSCENAVRIDAPTEREGIAQEGAWIRENYPGAKKEGQDLIFDCNGKSVRIDAIRIETANGQKVIVFFDISGWFGKF